MIVNAVPPMEALRQCLKPVEQAHCLPPHCYRDDEWLETEIPKVFLTQWLCVGRADQLPSVGAYQAIDIAGVPVLLTRDKEGQIHALNNSCRHRGARLLEGAGECKAIKCPFHAWGYALDGRFLGGPHLTDTDGFDKAEQGLHRFSVAEHAGFLFVCLAPEPPEFTQHIGNFDQFHHPWPLASLQTTRTRTFDVACNWKAFLDVFNEYYHLQWVHPDSINALYQLPDAGDLSTGNFATQFGATEGTGALLESDQGAALPKIPELSGREAEGTRYTWVFPNMAFAASTEAMWMYEAYPISAHRCRVRQWICFPETTIQSPGFAERAAQYYKRLDAAIEEDRIALENQHQGLCSPFAQAGRFSVRMEPNVAAFARWYAEQVLATVLTDTP